MSGRTFALPAMMIVIGGVVLDQAAKWWIMHGVGLTEDTRLGLGPFVDLVLVWNPGISYGLFQQNSDFGRWALVALAAVAAAGMGVWMARAQRALVAISLALIVAGAIGNGIDRLIYGAVIDFVYLHAGGFSWYVFNLGDAWIVAGVIGLMYDSIRHPNKVSA